MAAATVETWSADRPAPFVGRREELAALQRWTQHAWSGDVVIAWIVGEAGVGKSALLERMTTEWIDDGATVFIAACDERVSIPYLPLTSAMGVDPTVDSERQADAVMAGNRVPALFVELADRLIEAAGTGRVVLRIDDLQWADPATLDLVSHMVVHALRRSSHDSLTLLVVISTQPLPEGTAVQQFQARLDREPGYREGRLESFDELDVNELLERLLGRRVSRALLAEVFEATNGNPLAVRSAIAGLRDRRALEIVSGEVRSSSAVTPEQVTVGVDLQRRMEGLDGQVQELLVAAALASDETDAPTLARIAGLDDEAMDAAMDAVEHADLLVELPDGRLRFVDPAIRRQLAGSLPRRARERLHLQIAQTLAESVADDDDPLALEVAHHLRRAGPRARPELVARFATIAVHQSSRLGAWAKAARYGDLAVRMSAPSRPPPELLELHLAAALAHFRNHDADATAAHCAAATELARRIDDETARGKALLLGARARLTLTTDIGADPSTYGDLVEFSRTASADPAVVTRCWTLLTEVLTTAGDIDGARRAGAEAVARAVDSGDPVLVAEAEFAAGLTEFGDVRPLEAIGHFETSAAAAQQGGDDWILAWPKGRLVLCSVLSGDLRRAEAERASLDELCRRTHHWAEQGLATTGAAAVALQRGQLDEAELLAADALQIHARSSFPYIPSMAWPIVALRHSLTLDRAEAQRALADWAASGVRGSSRFSLLVDALTLTTAELAETVDLDHYRRRRRDPGHVFTVAGLAIDVEVGVRLGALDIVEQALVRLDELAARGTRLLLPTGASVDRLRAMACLALGDTETADAQFDEAVRFLDRAGAAVESFWTETERFRSRLRADPGGARQDAERLAVALRGAGLLALHAHLVADAPVAIDEGGSIRRTVVCWDVVESTPLLIASGDAGYVEFIRDLEASIERRLVQYGGVTFKHTGDGLYAWFTEPGQAVRCTRAVEKDLLDRNRRRPEQPITLRTGVAVGRPIADQTDLFGVTVVTAARLCSVADRGQILCTDQVASEAGLGLTTPIGPMRLKGLADDVVVHAVT